MAVDASDISTYLAGKVIDHLLRAQAFTPPANVYLSAHTADPGMTGASEVAVPGAAGYARAVITFNPASSKNTIGPTVAQGVVTLTMPSTLPTNTVVPWVGLWDAATAGNFLWRVPILGTTIMATIDAASNLFDAHQPHGYSAGDRVVFYGLEGGPPSGITEGVAYFVLAAGLTADAFEASATAGGAALDMTSDGSVVVRKVTANAFSAGYEMVVEVGAVSLDL